MGEERMASINTSFMVLRNKSSRLESEMSDFRTRRRHCWLLVSIPLILRSCYLYYCREGSMGRRAGRASVATRTSAQALEVAPEKVIVNVIDKGTGLTIRSELFAYYYVLF